jgi:hypothetical protein
MDYQDFLTRKKVSAPPTGFEVPEGKVNPTLFDWQRSVTRWACKRGNAALFEECGLGKTFQQLDYARLIYEETRDDFLIVAPLAVNAQTVREGAKLGIEVHSARSQSDVKPGINITNYEMLEHFDLSRFGGVVLDESSILKSFMGKTKRFLIESFSQTPYRLCCTATPAPNDHMEIGNHAEFLGIMKSNEMLSRWFINDTMKNGSYRLKKHAESDFWEWVASWAMALRKPSDLGAQYSDAAYKLPRLNMEQLFVDVDETIDADGALFRNPNINATTMHKEMRLTCEVRAGMARDIISQRPNEEWVVWCNTNYEADALKAVLPEAVEVRGNDSIAEKERKLTAFTNGEERIIITKPGIAGFGLNWQHCRNAVFVGLSYSFEQFYQALRRNYRFGQTREVNAHIITARTEGPILDAVRAKMAAHETMMDGMVSGRRFADAREDLQLAQNAGEHRLQIPAWLHSSAASHSGVAAS